MLEIKPILSTLLRHKSSSLLTILQIAITFAVVVNSISIINQRIERMNRDTGLEESQILALNVNPIGEDYDQEFNFKADAELVRGMPGVIDAVVINQVPLSGSGDSSGVAASQEQEDNLDRIPAGFFRGDNHLVNTLGLTISAGRNFNDDEVFYTDVMKNPNVVLITQSLADKLFPDGDALDNTVYFWGLKSKVIGIVDKMAGPWVQSARFEDNLIQPVIALSRFSRMIVRVEESQLQSILGSIEKTLLDRNPNRVITSVRSLKEIKQRSYSSDNAMTMILWIVIVLLIVVTALGIVGLVSFNVRQRIKQIGTRRALGATKTDIVRYFVTENILITAMGITLGTIITISLNIYLVKTFELAPLQWLYIPVGIVVMFLTGIIAVWLPAKRASSVSPAVATQTI